MKEKEKGKEGRKKKRKGKKRNLAFTRSYRAARSPCMERVRKASSCQEDEVQLWS